MEAKKGWFAAWKEKHAALWQFVMFILMSGITTVVDLATFALLNFWIFSALKGRAFSWGPIDYSVANGGLCAFLAFAVSFALSQTFNFFLQRKTTFKANNNALASGLMYAVMVLFVYFLQLYVPTLIREPVVRWAGPVVGDLGIKALNMVLSMLIQFPVNKYIIMRRKKD